MNSDDYQKSALETENIDCTVIHKRLNNKKLIRLLHAAMGASTEAGELEDQLKKHIFYGKKLDILNIFEELGDLLWYIAVALDTIGEDFSNCMEANHKKLHERYKNGFSKKEAIARDLEKEVKILQQSIGNKGKVK